MRFFDVVQSEMLSVWFIPHHTPNSSRVFDSSNIDFDFVPIERILLLVLFLILFFPLLKERKNPELEKERRAILKLSAIAGALALLMRLMRLIFMH